MAEEKVDVFFRGDIVAGENLPEVRERLQQLFNADDQQLQRLFSGRPVAIRRDLDREEGKRYQIAMYKAGAQVELRPVKAEAQQQGGGDTHEDDDDISLAPIGADMLNKDERAAQSAVEVDTSALSLASLGGDILKENEKTHIEPVTVDTSHLSIDDVPPQ